VCSSEDLQALSQKRLQAAQAKLKYSKLAKNKAIKIGNERALNANIESAEKGETYGLKRMAERYRKGEGVEKDLKRAEYFSKKAEEAGEVEEQSLLAASKMGEEDCNKQMFERALRGVETGDYLSALTVARCYRDGKGTDKDLELALKYYEKVPALKRSGPYNAVPDTYQFEIDEVRQLVKAGKGGY
jgi:TPR repeat protein